MKIELVIDGRTYNCTPAPGPDQPIERDTIGHFLKMARTNKKLRTSTLAECLEISPDYLSQIERGLRNPSFDVTVRWCKLCEVEYIPTNLIFVRNQP